MNSAPPTRAVLLTFALAASIAAQMPATSPTAAPQKAAETLVAQTAGAKRAQVTFASGVLTVNADNSSLNQILREIGRVTGMKITGGVNDERVYGTYGPADTSTILATLLRGTGSNMLLVVAQDQRPAELVLTPRNGGVSPPNPNAAREDDPGSEDLPPQRQQRDLRPDGGPAPALIPPPPAANRVLQPPTPDTTTQESPNGVKTPQQIYDQLMKMQQQQQKTPQ